ncbi:MAG: DUF2087 domain-containing protein [Rubrivivax sp.]|nr:DUF2087 domain-containing protein [Rubrivivax sp.]
MPRTPTPLVVDDLSRFVRHLGRSLTERHATEPSPPGHQELMNLVSRAAGHRNLQALKASAPPPLTDNAHKALGQFDAEGRLVRWPVKFSVQRLVMWTMWTRFDAGRTYTEREVNTILKDTQTFGDHVTLRRELINHKLLERKSDCSEYRKLPARADDEARAFLTAWRAQVRQAPPRPRTVRPDAPVLRRRAAQATAAPAAGGDTAAP